MTCDEALILISSELDGELSAFEEQSLQHHLAKCERCRATRSEWLRLQRAAQHSPAPTAPPELRCRVAAGLLREGLEHQLWQTVMTARGRTLITTERKPEWTHTRLSHPVYCSNN